MKAKIKILHAGTFASIQDEGRISYAKYGVPRSGWIDKKSAQKVNILLRNETNAAVLEWTQIGPILEFTEATQIAISHTSNKATLNGASIRALEVINVPKDGLLSLGYNQNVVYSYLAIKEGFKTKCVLKSRSMQNGITKFGLLQSKSKLSYTSQKVKASFFKKPTFDVLLPFRDTFARAIDAYQGPEYHLLNDTQKNELEQYFTLSIQRNRMGMQISELVPNALPSMLSVPIMPGTVQLTPSGKLIVLDKDCQTTGGYPRILHLPEKALAQLSQTAHGVRFRFKIINYD